MSYSDNEYESDDENAELDEELYDGKKNVGIILIDVCHSMFNSDSNPPFKICLAAVYEIMNMVLLKTYRRNISVCLLQDEDITLTALNDNLVQSAKKIKDMLKQSIEELRKKYERKSAASLRNCLTEAMKQFSKLEKVNPYIVILTDDDNPHQGDQRENLGAYNVALSLRDFNVKLVVLPLKEEFNYEVFYAELLKSANDMPLDLFEEGSEPSYTDLENLIEVLSAVIKDGVRIRRFMFRMFETQDQGAYFWVQLRYLAREKHMYKNCKLSRATNNKVKQEYNADFVEMDQWEVKSNFFEVSFDKKEYLYQKMPVGFRLLYVSKEKQLSIHRMHKTGFILQKDELTEEDGQNIFDYMWQYCRDKNRFLICGYYVPGNKQYPKIVELAPDTFQSRPCFIGHFLANCDEINLISLEDNDDASQKKADIKENDPNLMLVCDMIDKLKVKFKPQDWPCIAYETKAAHIKAQLLDIDVPEVEECCFPPEGEVTKRLGATNDELIPVFAQTVAPTAPKRRKKQ